MAAAKNIVSGNGASILKDSFGNSVMTWPPWRDNEVIHLFPWPPFYSAVLSIFGFLKINLFLAARFLNALLFGLNIFLVTYFIRRYLRSSFLMIFAAIVLITSRQMIEIHSMLWSEPLFIFLGLTGFMFLFYFLENKKSLFLLAASLFFGLAFFTRTIGISLVATGAFAVLLYSGMKLKNKIVYSALSVFVGLLPFLVWTLKNRLAYGSNSTEIMFLPLHIRYYSSILDTLSLWIIPYKASLKIRIILIAIIIVVLISISIFIAYKNNRKNLDNEYKLNSKIIRTLLFFILFYFIALLMARHFFDESITIGDSRILILALIAIFTVFIFFLKRFIDFFYEKENIKLLAYLFCGLMITSILWNTNFISLYKYGHWYSTNAWYSSETLIELKKIQKVNTPIYTNEPAVIYLFLERGSMQLPEKSNMRTGKLNSNYQEELNKTLQEAKENAGLIVFFDQGYGIFPKEQEIMAENNNDYKLQLFKDTTDGAIYKIN
jgi:hypothetical protein